MPIYMVRRETRDLIRAFNKRAVGRNTFTTGPDDGGPLVGIELSDDVVNGLKAKFGDDLDAAIAKLVWGAGKLVDEYRARDAAERCDQP